MRSQVSKFAFVRARLGRQNFNIWVCVFIICELYYSWEEVKWVMRRRERDVWSHVLIYIHVHPSQRGILTNLGPFSLLILLSLCYLFACNLIGKVPWASIWVCFVFRGISLCARVCVLLEVTTIMLTCGREDKIWMKQCGGFSPNHVYLTAFNKPDKEISLFKFIR